MALARKEARRSNHGYIGTEHILLGIVREGGGSAIQALRNLGVEIAGILQHVEKHVRANPGIASRWARLPFSPRAKKALEHSASEAKKLGHQRVRTAHVLLGIVRECDSVGAQMLQDLGLKLDDIREEVCAVLDEDAEQRGRKK